MKTPTMRVLALSTMLAAGMLLGACQQNETKDSQSTTVAAATRPAGANPNFYAVQDKLNPGGNFYLFMDISGMLRNLTDGAREQFGAQSPEIARIINVGEAVVDRLGLYELESMGMSIFEEADDWTVTRSYLHLPEGRKGVMGLLGGEAAEPFGLDRAPADTSYFVSMEIDVAKLIPLAREVARDIGGIQGTTRLDEGLSRFQQQSGVSAEALLGSLGGHFTMMMNIDPVARMQVPMGPGGMFEAPKPRFTLLIEAKDSTLLETVTRLAAMTGKAGPAETLAGGGSLTPLMVPENPVYSANAAFGQAGDLFFLTTHREHAEVVLAGTGGLAATPEFTKMLAGLPERNNSLVYMSPAFGEAYLEFLENLESAMTGAMQQGGAAGMNPTLGQFAMAKKIAAQSRAGGISMRVNEPEGVLWISRGQYDVRKIMAMALAAPMGAMAGIAMPNYLEAQTRAKVARVHSDTRTMATALEAYYIDNNIYPPMPDPLPANYDSRETLHRLTTPVAYLSELFEDSFAEEPGETFRYYSTGGQAPGGWILWSPGPDQTWQMDYQNIQRYYTGSRSDTADGLIENAYDPTNGTTSLGDVFRFKQ